MLGRMIHRPWRSSLLGLALVAAACTSTPERPADRLDLGTGAPRSAGAASPSTSPSAPGTIAGSEELGRLTGHLAVLDSTGSIATLAPDGSDRIVVAASEPGRSENRQPAWASDGSRVAWVHVELSEDQGLEAAVATSAPDGSDATAAVTGVVPFYLSWDPTSSRVAYLGNGEEEIEFGVVEMSGPTAAIPVDTGRPFYVSWAPDGDELLIHAGEDRLERIALDGSATRVGDEPGTFTAPVWTGDGRSFVYATAGSLDDRLVVRHLREDAARDLVPFDGVILFVVSPDGRRVAYQVVGETQTTSLSVIDLASGETTEVFSDGLVAAFFWSPDGERLLVLDPVPEPDEYWYRWLVWDGRDAFATPRFVPSLLWVRDYMPFFEQYAQSMGVWSPDGSAFAYAGMGEDGESGVWVQPAEPDRSPVRVADGELVTWSPA